MIKANNVVPQKGIFLILSKRRIRGTIRGRRTSEDNAWYKGEEATKNGML